MARVVGTPVPPDLLGRDPPRHKSRDLASGHERPVEGIGSGDSSLAPGEGDFAQ